MAKRTQRWRQHELVVELANVHKKQRKMGSTVEEHGPVNTQQFLKTFDASFRGRWSTTGLRGVTTGSTQIINLPDLPGIHIVVNPRDRTIKAVDPLGWKEHADLVDRWNKTCKSYFGLQRACDTSVINNASPTDLKTAVWELFNLVEQGKANVVSGTMPERGQILAQDGEIVVRGRHLRTFQTKDGLETESKYATPEELEKMGKPPVERVTHEPAGG